MPNCWACLQCIMAVKERPYEPSKFGYNLIQETGLGLANCIRSLSDIVGNLDIISIISGKIEEIRHYSNTNIQAGSEKKNAVNDHNAASDDDNNNLHHTQNTTKLKHSHSQSCVTSCMHRHHTKIATWRHAMNVHRSHVPQKLREPYIEYGYLLPFMPWRYYVRALYTPSYEFMNVWTHLVPSLYFFYLLYTFSQEMDVIHVWPLFLITFSGAVLGGFSALAHLFHSRSSLHHSCWFIVDYFGITLYAFASLVTNFYSGAQLQYYRLLSKNYLYISLICCFFGYTCLCLTQTNKKCASTKLSRQLKVFVNGFGYLFGAIPLFQRMYENIFTGIAERALQYHGLAVITMLVAPMLYGTDIPQRLYPGKFDVFGHSHMWFHILTAAAAWFDIQAVYFDVLEGPWKVLCNEDDYPTILEISFYYAVIILFGIVFGYLTHYAVKCDYPHEEPFLQGKLRCACGLPGPLKETRDDKLGRSISSPNVSEWIAEEKLD